MMDGRTPGPAVLRLAADLLDRDPRDAVAVELVEWLAGSTPFRAYAQRHRDKIRKKLRSAADADAVRDVLAELQVARLILADRRIALTLEPYGSGKGGPDLRVTFRGTPGFNLEVTRRRAATTTSALAGLVLAKLRQLPPSAPNAILIAVAAPSAEQVDVASAVRLLRARADAKDEAFFASQGFAGARAFYDRFLRLGGVYAWCVDASATPRATLWTNRSARIALPEQAARACLVGLSVAV